MTCIIGVVDKETVWMVGDSAAINGWNNTKMGTEKIFHISPYYLIGCAGSIRICNVIRYGFKPRPPVSGMDSMEHMVTQFVPQLQVLLTENKVLSVEDEVGTMNGSILVGYNGNLYVIEQDFQVFVHSEPFSAVGGGENLAICIMDALFNNTNLSIQDLLTKSLDIVCKYYVGATPPYTIKFLTK